VEVHQTVPMQRPVEVQGADTLLGGKEDLVVVR